MWSTFNTQNIISATLLTVIDTLVIKSMPQLLPLYGSAICNRPARLSTNFSKNWKRPSARIHYWTNGLPKMLISQFNVYWHIGIKRLSINCQYQLTSILVDTAYSFQRKFGNQGKLRSSLQKTTRWNWWSLNTLISSHQTVVYWRNKF